MVKLPKDGLNIIPLIDVMLVLLAIVLSVSTFIAQGQIKVDLPSANAATQDQDDVKVEVSIDKDNNYYIDGVMISAEDLEKKLNEIDSKTLIELKSDKDSSFGKFVTVIDILKGKQHENFSIATQIQ